MAKRKAKPQKPSEPADEPWGGDGLTFKQREFVRHYLTTAAGNATKAAQLAGFQSASYESLRAAGSETVRRPKVAAAIAKGLALAELDPENIKAGIGALAQSSLANFLKQDADGDWVPDLDQAAELGALGQLKEITWMKISLKGGGEKVVPEKIKIHDPLPARALMAKIQGMLKDNLDITSAGKPITVKVLRGVSMDEL